MENLNTYMLERGEDTRLIITVGGDSELSATLIDSQRTRKVLMSADSDDLENLLRILDDQAYVLLAKDGQ